MSEQVLNALQDMADAFPRDGVTANTIRVYLERLGKFPDEVVVLAINQAIDTRTFFPAIGELTAIISELAVGQDELAETAWLEVQAAARKYGYQPRGIFRDGKHHDLEKPTFSTPLIAECVESVGWKMICLAEMKDAREAFIFTYRSLRRRDVNRIQRGDFGGISLPAGRENVFELERGAS